MYLFPHLLQSSKYMQLCVSQLKGLSMCHVSLWFTFTSLIVETYRQAVHFLPHLFIPFNLLWGYLSGAGGTFAFTDISLVVFFLLCAVIGGSLKTSLRYWFCPVIALQCFTWMVSMDGNLRSNFNTKTSLFLDFLSVTVSNAIFLGIFFFNCRVYKGFGVVPC